MADLTVEIFSRRDWLGEDVGGGNRIINIEALGSLVTV
jgi:hypothetical protein